MKMNLALLIALVAASLVCAENASADQSVAPDSAAGDPEQSVVPVAPEQSAARIALMFPVDVDYYGGAFGTSYEKVVGSWCPLYLAERAYFEAYSVSGDGWCTAEPWKGKPLGWASGDSRDCHVRIHVGAGMYKSGTCRVNIYYWEKN